MVEGKGGGGNGFAAERAPAMTTVYVSSMQSEHLICVARKIYFYSVFSFFFFLSSSSSSSSSFFVLFRRDDVLSVHLLPLPARSLYSPTACLPACLCVITFIFLSFFFAVAASAVCILFRRPSVGWTVTADEMETLNRGGFFFILFVSHLNVVLILVELAATFLRRWTIVYKKKTLIHFLFLLNSIKARREYLSMRQKRRETEAVQVIVRTYLSWKVRFFYFFRPIGAIVHYDGGVNGLCIAFFF